MKFLLNQQQTMRIKINRKILLLCAAACSMMLFLHSPGISQAQVAELEIIGRKQTAFFLSVEGLPQNSKPVNRIVVKNLKPGPNNLIIEFKDTLHKPFETAISLQPYTRNVYRLTKKPSSAEKEASFEPFRKIKMLISDNGGGNSYYSLKLLETTAVSHNYEENKKDTVTDDTVIVRQRASSYHFTRENPNNTGKTDTATTISDDGASRLKTETLDTISGYNNQKKTVLTENQHKKIISSVSALSFEEDRIDYLTRELKDVSLSSKQLGEILKQFDFERSKLQVSKLYYQQLIDKENVTELYQSFEFNTTIEELKRWIYEQSR